MFLQGHIKLIINCCDSPIPSSTSLFLRTPHLLSNIVRFAYDVFRLVVLCQNFDKLIFLKALYLLFICERSAKTISSDESNNQTWDFWDAAICAGFGKLVAEVSDYQARGRSFESRLGHGFVCVFCNNITPSSQVSHLLEVLRRFLGRQKIQSQYQSTPQIEYIRSYISFKDERLQSDNQTHYRCAKYGTFSYVIFSTGYLFVRGEKIQKYLYL